MRVTGFILAAIGLAMFVAGAALAYFSPSWSGAFPLLSQGGVLGAIALIHTGRLLALLVMVIGAIFIGSGLIVAELAKLRASRPG